MPFARPVTNIDESTTEYEHWLSQYLTLVPEDLRLKHRRMKQDPFSFFRATYYRWAEISDQILIDSQSNQRVLAVGDLHVENFGTWRDAEGRLVWGINDFDEGAQLPFTCDLVRLATSGAVAHAMKRLRIAPADICEAVLLGYRDALEAGGAPFVLAADHHWLRATALNDLRDPVRFWKKIGRLRSGRLPVVARRHLTESLPKTAGRPRFGPRVAGLGSLGRPRYLALATCQGGLVARELRALAPSAVHWARRRPPSPPAFRRFLQSPIRTADPFVYVRGNWLLRRLAPDCSRIELESLPKRYDEYRLMHAMGWETANVHLGSSSAQPLRRQLRRLGNDWLLESVGSMAEALRADWKVWRRG